MHDSLVAQGTQTLRSALILLCLESLLDPFPSVLGKLLANWFRQMLRFFVGRFAEEANLLSVSAAPLTKQKMDPQANLLHQGEFPIKCLRLKSAGLLASGGQQGNRFGKRFHHQATLVDKGLPLSSPLLSK